MNTIPAISSMTIPTSTSMLPIQPGLPDLPMNNNNNNNIDFASLSKAERRRLKRKEKLFAEQQYQTTSMSHIDEEMHALGSELSYVKAVVQDDEAEEEEQTPPRNPVRVKRIPNPDDLEDGEVDE